MCTLLYKNTARALAKLRNNWHLSESAYLITPTLRQRRWPARAGHQIGSTPRTLSVGNAGGDPQAHLYCCQNYSLVLLWQTFSLTWTAVSATVLWCCNRPTNSPVLQSVLHAGIADLQSHLDCCQCYCLVVL